MRLTLVQREFAPPRHCRPCEAAPENKGPGSMTSERKIAPAGIQLHAVRIAPVIKRRLAFQAKSHGTAHRLHPPNKRAGVPLLRVAHGHEIGDLGRSVGGAEAGDEHIGGGPVVLLAGKIHCRRERCGNGRPWRGQEGRQRRSGNQTAEDRASQWTRPSPPARRFACCR